MAGTTMTSLNQLSGFRNHVSGYSPNRWTPANMERRNAKRARKWNLFLFGLVWTMGVLTLLWVWNGSADAGTKSTTIRVASGDTVWSIAQQVSPHQDPRVVSNEIMQLNHLTGADPIYPGETLKIPVR